MPTSHPLTRAYRNAGLFLCVLLLCACSTLPSSPQRDTLDAFSLEGRFSLRHEDKSYSGRLSWKHAGANNELLLASPFGQGMADITTSENGAQLTTSDGKVYSAVDAETLIGQVLGYPLPLAQLTDWVRGRSTTAGDIEVDQHGRLLRLRQQDWRIDYDYESDDPQAPPSRIIAERIGGTELRLRIEEWNNLSPEENKP